MRPVVVASFLVTLISLHEEGNATRYLPSIVWDHYNPMLSCKCNWFNTNNLNNSLVKVEIYDRFEYVCPTELLNVRLLDKHSRPRSQMNLNLFKRKWKNGYSDLDGLKAAMKSGEFCDPDSNETESLLTCKNGEKGKGVTVRFAIDTNYVKDDLVVFFNNGDDGRESTLTSKEKKCAMAFIVLVTWQEPMKHDLTYGKNLEQREECMYLDKTCEGRKLSPTPTLIHVCPSTSQSSTSSFTTSITTPNITSTSVINTNEDGISTFSTFSTIKPTQTTITKTIATHTSTTTRMNSTVPSSKDPSSSKRHSCPPDWDRFKNGLLVGVAITLLINIVIITTYCLVCRRKKQSRSCHEKVEDIHECAVVNQSAEEDAKPLPEKVSESMGNNNKGYQSTTLKRENGIMI